MDLFTTVAYATEGTATQQGGIAALITSFLPLVLIIVVFYFLLIRHFTEYIIQLNLCFALNKALK